MVTTPLRPSPAVESEARAAAVRHALPYSPRGTCSAAKVAHVAGADALLILSPHASVLVVAGEERGWSPGMGTLRAKRLRLREAGHAGRTERDPFLEAAALRAGDLVLDCTVGLAADALVAAAAIGPRGRLVGIEASPVLAAWVAEGLRRLEHEAAGRIEIQSGDHEAVLAALPERSFDVVVFDPMFRHARAEPAGFDMIRLLGDPRPLSSGALARARRVARRWVVVKDGAPGWDLARLGLAPLPSARGAHRYYARVPAE